jgi:L-asparaginase II
MVEQGLELEPRLLALSAASHAAQAFHLEGARAILARADLAEAALQTPPDLPLDAVERTEWIATGQSAVPIAMNCSGKHAAMLATCVLRGWSTSDYLDPSGPLTAAIIEVMGERTGERPWAVAVDGCGAPLIGVTLAGLARGASRVVQAASGSPDARVADAMRSHPEYVGGTRLEVTAFMRAVPGLLAKNGAEGVYVGALPDGRGLAMKVEDGADRAQVAGFAGLLAAAGVPRDALEGLLERPILGGGRPVGVVRPVM